MLVLTKPKEPGLGTHLRPACLKSLKRKAQPTSGPRVFAFPGVPNSPGLAFGERLFFAVITKALTDALTPRQTTAFNVWDSPRVKAILEQSEDAPIDLSGLTEEERDALAREAKGMWADHPYIKDSVEWVRELRGSNFLPCQSVTPK
jgi:hypothetical protein